MSINNALSRVENEPDIAPYQATILLILRIELISFADIFSRLAKYVKKNQFFWRVRLEYSLNDEKMLSEHLTVAYNIFQSWTLRHL